MRKTLSLLLAALMLLSLAPLALAESAENVTWVSLGGGMPENYESWKAKVDAYLTEKIGATLTADILSWGAYGDRRNAIINGGEYFDIIFTDGGSYAADIAKGVLLDIKPLLDNVPALRDVVPASFWDAITIDGKIYAVPTLKDSALAHFFVFDPEVIEGLELDISGVKTLADLDPIFRKMKEGNDKVAPIESPFKLNKGGAYHMLDVYDGAGVGVPVMGVRYDDEGRKVVSVFETEEIMKNLEQLHTWYNDGIINADAATLAEAGSNLPFYVAQGWAGAWTYTKEDEATKESRTYTGLTQPFIGPIASAGSIMGSMNGVYAGAKNPELVMKFLELVNTDTKLRDMICYGEEGVNFEYKDGLVEQNNDKPWPWARYTQANHAILTPTTANPDLFTGISWVNDNAVPSVLMGFILDRSNIEDELALIIATYEKYLSELITGTAEPTEIVPAMMDEIRAVGFDTVMEEFQKQVDAFFAK